MNDLSSRSQVTSEPLEPSTVSLRFRIRTVIKFLLLLLTIFTVLTAGTLLMGKNPFEDASSLMTGIPYAIGLFLILLSHSGGHYYMALRMGAKEDMPWVFPSLGLTGTSGFIDTLPTSLQSKKARVIVGLSGPTFGMIISTCVSIYGLSLSEVAETVSGESNLILGDPPIYIFVQWIVLGNIGDNMDILLHPIAFAGWWGFFLSAVHLIPIDPLDGGYIARALIGKNTRWLTLFTLFCLIVTGIMYNTIWVYLAFLLAVGVILHRWAPRIYAFLFWRRACKENYATKIDLGKKEKIVVFVFAVILFFLCFNVSPVSIGYAP